MTAFVIELVTSLLEASVALCIVVLQYYHDDATAQEAMLYMELALLALQVGLGAGDGRARLRQGRCRESLGLQAAMQGK